MLSLRITADDFGATKGVNRAVEQLHVNGIVNYAALMTMGGELQDAVEIFNRNSRLEPGLHFTLTDEVVHRNLNSLGVNGKFFSRSELLHRIILMKIRTKDIEKEFDRQYQEMVLMGIKPTFVNSHQHVHALPIVSSVVAKKAAQYKLYVRYPYEGVDYRCPIPHFLKKTLMALFSYRLKVLLNKYRVPSNSYLLSNFSNCSRDFSIDGFCALLEKAKKISPKLSSDLELMIHPSVDEKGLNHYWYHDKSHTMERVSEYKSLMSKQFKTTCHEQDFIIR